MFVSLGSQCSVAAQLRNLGISGASLPFDWIRSPDFNSVLQILVWGPDGMKQWFRLDQFELVKTSDQFRLAGLTDEERASGVCAAIYRHKSLGLGFYHDFRSDQSLAEQFSALREKYQRRLKRLWRELAQAKEVVFIRDELKPNRVDSDHPTQLLRWLDQTFPHLNYRVVWLVRQTKRHYPFLDCTDSRIEFYMDQHQPGQPWWRPLTPWRELILKETSKDKATWVSF